MEVSTLLDARSPGYTPEVKRLPNVKALTSVRFFAALHVAFFHLYAPFGFNRWGILAGVVGSGYLGVSFFFLLSGFILTYSHALEFEKGKGRYGKFLVARFARIYPIYLLSLTLAGFLNRGDLANKHVIAFVADLFAVQSWSVRLVNFFNLPAWSVSVEVFFYLLFPIVLMRLRPSSTRRALLAVGGFWLLALAVPVYCLVRFPEMSWVADTPGTHETFIYNVRRLPILALPEFLAGISLGWLLVRSRPSRGLAAGLATVGLALTMAALLLANHLPMILLHNGLLIPCFAMLLVGLCEENWVSRLLSNPLLVILGEASFALYLFHSLLIDATKGIDSSFRWAPMKLILIIPLSVVLHLCVERPSRRAILNWWHLRHPDQLGIVR
jgi:peptidoglycan/LPS O-acetylase OafA/YrhL